MTKKERFSLPFARGIKRVALKKRKLLLIAGISVCLPLGLMMGLQYFWLVRLKATSNIGRNAAQDHFLSLVSQKVEFFYSRLAETMLVIDVDTMQGPREMLGNHLSQQYANAVKHFSRPDYETVSAPKPEVKQTVLAEGSEKTVAAPEMDPWAEIGDLTRPETWENSKKLSLISEINGASSIIFVSAFRGPHANEFLFMDPMLRIGSPTIKDSELEKTIRWACIYWEARAHDPTPTTPSDFVLDYRDARYPMIINPIADAQGHLAGVAGLVIDPVHFGGSILPNLVLKLAPLLQGQSDWQVKVYNGSGELVLSNGSGAFVKADHPTEKSGKIGSVFADWKITLSSQPSPLEHLAGTNLWYNILLSLVLALALLGGILYALRTASQELQLSEMKSDFVSNVSHELRTPLASIRVFGELLRLGRTSDPAKVKEYGAHIESESRRLSRLINNILDFSKIESNQKIYQFERTDIEDVLSEIIQTFEARMFGGKVSIEYSGPEDSLPMMYLDADALGQVFFNLLDNGIKYGNGSLALSVRLYREDEHAVLEFSDHGIGIAPEQVDKIFERFHRVSTGLVHDVKGSGLGLAIARHVIAAHHGSIKVTSKVGEGSTFIIHLPLKGPEPGAAEKF